MWCRVCTHAKHACTNWQMVILLCLAGLAHSMNYLKQLPGRRRARTKSLLAYSMCGIIMLLYLPQLIMRWKKVLSFENIVKPYSVNLTQLNYCMLCQDMNIPMRRSSAGLGSNKCISLTSNCKHLTYKLKRIFTQTSLNYL